MAFCAFFVLFCALTAPAQGLSGRYTDYIERYKQVALQHQQEFGIPACITLAQGLLESNAGCSYLAKQGNNHFGIKCYHWRGDRVEFNDTTRHVCYRKYGCAEDSFLDHARFLKGPRYSVLYKLDISDYRSWAQGLRDCGYAEDPDYPVKLIRLIEQYKLYALDGSPRQPSPQEIKQEQDKLQRSHESLADKDREIKQRSYHNARQGRVAASADND